MVIKLKIINRGQTFLEDEDCQCVRKVKIPQKNF